LIERVIVLVEGNTEKVKVEIHWHGGYKTRTPLVRPVAKLEQLSYSTCGGSGVPSMKAGLTSNCFSHRFCHFHGCDRVPLIKTGVCKENRGAAFLGGLSSHIEDNPRIFDR